MEEKEQTQTTLAGIGDNSTPQGVDTIQPDVNDLMDMDGNQVVRKYAPEAYKELMAVLDASAALKKRYAQRVITDAKGRAEAHALSKRANQIKLTLDRIRKVVQLPHKEKYEQIRDSFNNAMKDPITVRDGWMAGVTNFDSREAAKAAQIERDRLQAIADEEARVEAERVAEVNRVNEENEALRRQIAEMEAAKNPAKKQPAKTEPVKTEPVPESNKDTNGDQTPNPPVQEQSSAPESAPAPAPKAERVADVPVELGANQERVWSVKTFDPTRVDLNKLGVGFFGKGEVEMALNRYAKANKEQAVIDGVEFTSEIKTKLGR